MKMTFEQHLENRLEVQHALYWLALHSKEKTKTLKPTHKSEKSDK